jgi:hypothetical protein
MNWWDSLTEPEELTAEEVVIDAWRRWWLIDFDSRTLRNDFPDVLAQLEKTDVHIRALEEVFRALMEIHFDEGLNKQYLKTTPKDVFAVLRGEKQLELDVPKGFFVDLVEQMRYYYKLYLQWKWV